MRVVLERVLKRPLMLDPKVPASVLIARGMAMGGGLARGLLIVHRKMILEKGARVRTPSALHLGGGLIRLEAHCRVDCTSHEGISLGRNFKLGAFSHLIASGTLSSLGKGIRIGNNVGIGEFSYIGGAGGVEIGDDTIVGQYFSVHPENHVFDTPDRPIRDQGVTREGISIGSGCWIGAKVTILDGVRVGSNSVIAAGSVVTKSFPPNSLIGGMPARLLRDLNSQGTNDDR